VLAGLSVTCILLKKHNEKAQEETAAENSAGEILSVDLSQLTAVSFDAGERQVRFKRTDDAWKLDGDETFPVDVNALETTLASVSSVEAVRRLDHSEDLSEYGLDEPQNIITIKMEDGTEKTVTVGATNDSTGDDYVMLDGDDSEIYTVGSGLREAFSDDLYEYAVSEELPYLLAADIVGVRVERAEGGYELYLEDAAWKVAGLRTDESESASEDTEVQAGQTDGLRTDESESASEDTEAQTGQTDGLRTDENESVSEETEVQTGQTDDARIDESESASEEAGAQTGQEADPEAINDALAKVTGLSYNGYLEHNCTDASAYGLGEPAAVLTFSYIEDTEAGIEDVEAGTESESESESDSASQSVTCTLTFLIGDTDESGNYYVQLEGSAQIHTIPSAALAPFLAASVTDWISD